MRIEDYKFICTPHEKMIYFSEPRVSWKTFAAIAELTEQYWRPYVSMKCADCKNIAPEIAPNYCSDLEPRESDEKRRIR